jgi:hypothetical protein
MLKKLGLAHVDIAMEMAWVNVQNAKGKAKLTARYVIIARAKDTWSVLNVTEKVKLLTIWDKL